MLGTPDALALALGAVDVDVLWVAVMPAASPVLELGAVELAEGDVAELELALGLAAETAEPGALEALVEAL